MSSNNILSVADKSRAYWFTKNKNQQARGNISSDRLTRLDEELSYWKQRLIIAPRETRQNIFERLLKLRAEQTTLHLVALHEKPSPLNEQKTKSYIARYYRDCARLTLAIKKLS